MSNNDMNFPQVLFRLLSENKDHHAIYGWNADGKSFYIKEARIFNNIFVKESSAILKSSEDDFSSFMNFLLVARGWGFFYERGVNEDILEHPLFQRNRPELLHLLKKTGGFNQKRRALEGSSKINRLRKKQKKLFANDVVSNSTMHNNFSGAAAVPHVPNSLVPSNSLGVTDIRPAIQDAIESEVASRLGRITDRVASVPQNSPPQPVLPMNDSMHHHPLASRSLLHDPRHRHQILSSCRAGPNPSSIIGRSLHGLPEGRHPFHVADSLHGGLPGHLEDVHAHRRHLEDVHAHKIHLEDVHAHQLGLQHRSTMGYGTELDALHHEELLLRGVHSAPPRPPAGPFARMPPPGRLPLTVPPQEQRLLPGRMSLPLVERTMPGRLPLPQGERAFPGRFSLPAQLPAQSERALPGRLPLPAQPPPQDERALSLSYASDSLKNKKKLEEHQQEIDAMSLKISGAIQIKEARLEQMSKDKKFVDLPLMVSLLKNIQKDKDEVRRLDQEHLVKKFEYLGEETLLCNLENHALKDLLSRAVEVQSNKKEISAVMVHRAESLAMIPGPSHQEEKIHLERRMIEQRDEILASEQEIHEIQQRIRNMTKTEELLKKELKDNQGALTRMKAATIKIVKVEEEEMQKRIEWEANQISTNKDKALKSRRSQIKDLQREQKKLEKTLQRRKVYEANEAKLKKLSEKKEKVDCEAKTAVESVAQEQTPPETQQNPVSLEKQHALEEMAAAKMAVMMVRASRKQPVPPIL